MTISKPLDIPPAFASFLPETAKRLAEISLRMHRGGYTTQELATCDLTTYVLYSVRLYSDREGESDIHVTGQNNILALYEAALVEAHRRYRERVPVLPRDVGTHGAGIQP